LFLDIYYLLKFFAYPTPQKCGAKSIREIPNIGYFVTCNKVLHSPIVDIKKLFHRARCTKIYYFQKGVSIVDLQKEWTYRPMRSGNNKVRFDIKYLLNLIKYFLVGQILFVANIFKT